MNFSDIKRFFVPGKEYASAEIEPISRESVGVILDSEEAAIVDAFLQLKKDWKMAEDDFHLLICSRSKSVENSDFSVFLPKHISWQGKLKNENVIEFAARHYDVLISFAAPGNKLSAFLVSRMQAKLKIRRFGNAKENNNYDLLIATDKQQPDIFIQEVEKYLKQINRKTA